ncbi:hypothetical protein [Aeoliella mucimassa]|uniref:Uncharacterized protein n=1 Tax=Aeoliella mucimassa TaxID=2527972 RepID=A0A518AKA4_9BACT|nr:hypothetical protein [Aeoliella mucimassa]QDU55162.1 hypothetical protein Pan181_13480 [Aeoliella mucimassa]
MEPFSIVCETCGAKLKVRDPGTIGQIHACPKCESMVLIAAPAALADPATPASAAPSPSAPIATGQPPVEGLVAPSDFGAELDDLLTTAAPKSTSPEPSTPSAPEPVADSPLPAEDLSSEAVESTLNQTLADQPMASDALAEEAVAEQAAVAATGRSTTLLVSVGGSVACFALGLLAAAWFMGGGDTASPTQVAQRDPTVETPAPATFAEPEDDPVEVQKPVVETETDTDIPPEPTPPVAAELPELPDNDTPNALPDLPALDEEQPPAIPEVEEPAAAERVPDTLPSIDPLRVDASNLDLLLLGEGATATSEEQSPAPAEETPLPDAGDQPEDPLRVALVPSELRFEPGSASRGPSYSEEFGAGKLEARLADTLPSVTWRNVPLYTAANELSRLASVPITIRPSALEMARITATQPISVEANDSTVFEATSAIAEKVRLTAEATPTGVVLTKRGPAGWWNHHYKDVADLCPATGDASELADVVRKFVAPASWNEPDAKLEVDGKTLRVDQTTPVQYEMLIFCERLRKARGLATRTKYPSRLISIEPRLAQLQEPLARATTFAFVDWTPLVDVFEYWHQTSGLVVLVDWQHLADQDLRPRATMAASIENTKWNVALDTCLTPLDLAWVPIDGETILITTVDKAELDCWVEFYPGADAEAIRDRVESLADATTLAGMAVAEDSTGRFVIVRGNRQVHEAASSVK